MSENPNSNSVGCVVSFPSCGGSLNPREELRRGSASSAGILSASHLKSLPCCCNILPHGSHDQIKRNSQCSQNSKAVIRKLSSSCGEITALLVQHNDECVRTPSISETIYNEENDVIGKLNDFVNDKLSCTMTISGNKQMLEHVKPTFVSTLPSTSYMPFYSKGDELEYDTLPIRTDLNDKLSKHIDPALVKCEETNKIKSTEGVIHTRANGYELEKTDVESQFNNSKVHIKQSLSIPDIKNICSPNLLLSQSVPGSINEDIHLAANNLFPPQEQNIEPVSINISKHIFLCQETPDTSKKESVISSPTMKTALTDESIKDCNDLIETFSIDDWQSKSKESKMPNGPFSPKLGWGCMSLTNDNCVACIPTSSCISPSIENKRNDKILPVVKEKISDKVPVYRPPYESQTPSFLNKSYFNDSTKTIKEVSIACDKSLMEKKLIESEDDPFTECDNTKKKEKKILHDMGNSKIKISLEPCDSPVVIGKRRPPLQRGISRNKSDPKLLPVHIHDFIINFLPVLSAQDPFFIEEAPY